MERLTERLDDDEALAIFDALEPVDCEFMLGEWRGGVVRTGHPLERLLPTSGWDGKRFVDVDTVYPLVFKDLRGRRFAGNPALMPLTLVMKLPLPEAAWLKRLFLRLKFLYATRRSGARLRMTEFRGKRSATMIYDAKPIHDVFRKLDEARVMGCMRLEGQPRFFFFWLARLESDAAARAG